MITISFIIALSILFIHVTFWEGMIFGKAGEWLKTKIPDQIKVGSKVIDEDLKKPLYSCPICMAPWYGSLFIYLGIQADIWTVNNWLHWVLILFMAGGFNTVFIYVISACKSIVQTVQRKDIKVCSCTKEIKDAK